MPFIIHVLLLSLGIFVVVILLCFLQNVGIQALT